MRSIHQASYDNPLVRTYKVNQFTFTANGTIIIPVPKAPGGKSTASALGSAGWGRGFGGRVLSVEIQRVTTTFAGATTDSGVRIGDGTTAGKYFDSGLVIDESVTTAAGYAYLADTGSAVDIESGRTTITVSLVASVGSPAGVADVDIVIAWWQGSTV
jgi:hypothetical protein